MLAHIFYVFLVFSIGASIGFVYGCMFRVAGPACILLALLAFAPTMAKAECLESASAVRQAHGGAHATWHNVDGHRCYMAGYGRRHEAKVIPLPKERPAKFARATARPDEDMRRVNATGTNRLNMQQGYEEGARLLAIRLGVEVVARETRW